MPIVPLAQEPGECEPPCPARAQLLAGCPEHTRAVGTHADLCGEWELEEKCLDIHRQIALQEKHDAEGISHLAKAVDEALAQDFELHSASPHASYCSVSGKTLHRRKAHFQYLLNHWLQILSTVLPVSCRVLPRPWQVLEELHFQPPQAQRLWLSWWDSTRLGLLAGLTEDLLQSVLSYLQVSGKLLYFEDSTALKEHVFHNLTCLIDILNVFFQRDASFLLHKLLLGLSGEGEGEGEGFPTITVPTPASCPGPAGLAAPTGAVGEDGTLSLSDSSKDKPLNGSTAWNKFPCYAQNEVPHAEDWINGTNLAGQCFQAKQLQIEYGFPFNFPPGFFARSDAQINSHVVHRSDRKFQIFAYRGKFPLVVTYQPTKGVLQPDTLSIASNASLPNI
ncbi:Malignant fibrous histiocytoma-amplified sequence 1 [Cricetulus griseus]|uniref:Malignant fibrous histiocytoma-amplified sequence 1 n=1 Tax=Cricetulus griseus TaxID=10029 RepID=G3INZ2_CRIGR|nr:Malignant fibrous histiocytoma-amplified sequence 1 [Cricetulus griseus]